MELNSIIGYVLTALIAIGGWIVAGIQSHKKRKLEKANKLADRRYEAYGGFLKKMDDISAEMNKVPQVLMGEMTIDLLKSILTEKEDPNQALVKYNKSVFALMTDALKPMLIMKQELSSLKLVASDELLVDIQQMQELTDCLYNEFCQSLSNANLQESNAFEAVSKIGQGNRIAEFTALHKKITDQMRNEIQLS